ncbi:MAG: hypothetical protein EOM12_11840 [Verrucomicrobiae bacterium]|nr:hypothetical protein [Verrucomicrobiae bacterium]
MKKAADFKKIINNWEIRSDEEVDKVEREQRKRELEARKLEVLKAIPKRFRDESFDTYVCDTDKQRAMITTIKKGKSVALYGSNGTGKTHLAFAMVKYLLDLDIFAEYRLAGQVFNLARKSYEDPKVVRDIEKLKCSQYLIVDEVDKKFGTISEFLTLYEIINYRYNELLPTMLITNAEKDELIEVIGLASFDRIVHEGTAIRMDGKNYRRLRFEERGIA